MSDIFSKAKRSEIMGKVKSSRNNSTEMKLIKYFKEKKILGWRRNYNLFGKPDFAFPKKRIVIFADGCFWHGHDCRNTKPKQNEDYWQKKIAKNKERDRIVAETLINKNWIVIRIWECEIKNEILLDKMKILL